MLACALCPKRHDTITADLVYPACGGHANLVVILDESLLGLHDLAARREARRVPTTTWSAHKQPCLPWRRFRCLVVPISESATTKWKNLERASAVMITSMRPAFGRRPVE